MRLQPRAALSIAAHGEQYLTELLNHGRSELTATTYRDRLRWFGEWLTAIDCSLSLVTQGVVEQWIADQRARSLSPKTIHDNVGAVRSFFRWLEEVELVEVDPLRRIRALKVPRKLPQILPLSAVDRITAAAEDAPRGRVIIELLYGCMLRTSELVALDVGRLDLEGRTALIDGKGKRQRYVPMSPATVEAVRAWLPVRAEILAGGTRRAQAAAMRDVGMTYRQIAAEMGIAPCIAVQYVTKARKRAWTKPMTDALIVGQRGRLGAQQIRTIVKAIALDAGLQRRVFPHIFRHSGATHMHDRGMDIRDVQEVLGHASIATTEVYTHVALDRLKRTYDQTHPRGNRPSQ